MRYRYGEPVRVKGSPYWYVYRTDNATGAREKLSTKCTRRRDAERWRVEHEDAPELTEALTFARIAELFLSSKRLRPSSRKDYEGVFSLLRRKIGDRLFHTLTVRDLDQVLAEPDWSPRTRNKYLTILRGLYKWARARGYATDNPAELVAREREEGKDPRILSDDEEGRLLRACSEPYVTRCFGGRQGRIAASEWTQSHEPPRHLREAVFTALRTGLRRANVLDLSWSEVDLPRALIRIPASKAKGKHDITVPIAPDLLDVLRKLCAENEGKATPSTRVFESLQGIERAFRSACKRAGLLDVSFHDLRRTYLTRLAPHCDPKTLQALGGHADISTTMKHYLGTSEERMRAAITRTFGTDADGAGVGRCEGGEA